MNALIANQVMCSEPAPKFERGERGYFGAAVGCCQPGIYLVTLGGIDLEFCLDHATKRWKEQNEQTSG